MDARKPRKREVNFTANEKALLAHLIKRNPIVQSKKTDLKTVARKKEAWNGITASFNSHEHVHKRATLTLKRAWDNMKAVTRKANVSDQGSHTNGGPIIPPPPQQKTIPQAVPRIPLFCEVANNFDSDSQMLQQTSQDDYVEENFTEKVEPEDITSVMEAGPDTETNSNQDATSEVSVQEDNNTFDPGSKNNIHRPITNRTEHGRRTSDYIKREASIRIKHMEIKHRQELQTMKLIEAKQKLELETTEIYKQTAEIEKKRSILLLQKAKLDLEAAMANSNLI